MINIDGLSDLSSLTLIPKASIEKLAAQLPYIICQGLLESKIKNDPYVSVDIGFGQINLTYNNNELLYKFIPNVKAENMFVDTLVNDKSPLETQIEEGVRHRIMNVYKELL